MRKFEFKTLMSLVNGIYKTVSANEIKKLSEESEASVMWLPSKSASNTEEIESATKNGPKLITNLFGQETTITKNSVLFYIYEGGFVEKRIIFD